MQSPRLLLHAFSTFKFGGPQARFVQLVNDFGPRYHHVVMAMDGNYEAGERLDKMVPWEPLRLPVQSGGALANRPAFRRFLKARRPDLLITYNWGAIEWAAANLPRVVPHVHAEDGFGSEEALRQLPRRVWTRRILLGWTGVPVIVASRNLEHIAIQQWRLAANRVHFIANGVEVAKDLSTAPGTPAARLTIGTVAGLRSEKNLARLIRAFATVRKQHMARLVIVGDGPEREALEELARGLGVASDVEFAGYSTDPLAWIRTFDLFALASNTEQLPISMLEAMACGVPVAATRVGDVADIMPLVAHEALAPPDDEAFTNMLLRVIDQRAKWSDWAAAGIEQVRRHYRPESMRSRWMRVFDGHA